MVDKRRTCPKCMAGRLVIASGGSRNACKWMCSTSKSHKHFQQKLIVDGPLSAVQTSHLPAFLHFVVCMKSDMRMSKVEAALKDIHGIGSYNTLRQWYILYTDTLRKYLEEVDGMKLGGPDQVVVVDETFARAKRVVHKKGTPGRKGSRRGGHIETKLPGRTIWKRPAANIMKRPSCLKRPAGVMKKPSRDQRWIWGAVGVGMRGGAPNTHGAGTKRVHFALLPEADQAPEQKPRGVQSLAQRMHAAILSGSLVVSDEWAATEPAVVGQGRVMEGQVSHTHSFRHSETGIHSNDIESEFARFKLWSLTKFGSFRASNAPLEGDKRLELARKLIEYMFYVNVGKKMSDVMSAFSYATMCSRPP